MCVGSGKFKGQCAFFRRHRLFDKVPSKISNTKWRCATVHIDIIGIIDIDIDNIDILDIDIAHFSLKYFCEFHPFHLIR